jgi:two-component system, chemotaxis family, protein-glutamate methylesterase/glutaminase
MTAARILIVDDSAVTRKVLREPLASDPLMEVIGIVADGEKALKRMEECKPDIVRLDVELPGMSGLEALRHIRSRWARLPVIIADGEGRNNDTGSAVIGRKRLCCEAK